MVKMSKVRIKKEEKKMEGRKKEKIVRCNRF